MRGTDCQAERVAPSIPFVDAFMPLWRQGAERAGRHAALVAFLAWPTDRPAEVPATLIDRVRASLDPAQLLAVAETPTQAAAITTFLREVAPALVQVAEAAARRTWQAQHALLADPAQGPRAAPDDTDADGEAWR